MNIKQVILTILIIMIPTARSFALKGMVIVLEAPVFCEMDITADVCTYKRKGDLIYLHNKHNGKSALNVDYSNFSDEEYEKVNEFDNAFLASLANNPFAEDKDFYTTLDGRGRNVYILKKHVKVIYNDTREAGSKVTVLPRDVLDYRIEEPLPKGFPLSKEDIYRVSLSFSLGSSKNSNYPYRQEFLVEDYGGRYGALVEYTSNVRLVENNRLFFGGTFAANFGTNELLLGNQFTAKEINSEYSIGPIISFDSHRTLKYRLSFTGEITLNFNQKTIILTDLEDSKESRSFYSFSFSPRISTTLNWQTGYSQMFLFCKLQAGLTFPHKFAPYDKTESIVWNKSTDWVDLPIMGEYSLYLGLQFVQ